MDDDEEGRTTLLIFETKIFRILLNISLNMKMGNRKVGRIEN